MRNGFKDMTNLVWSYTVTEQSSGGTFFKAVDATVSPKRFYKLSRFDDYMFKTIGYESYFEVIASRLGSLLRFSVVPYHLIKGKIRVTNNIGVTRDLVSSFCYSEDFATADTVSKQGLDTWLRRNHGVCDANEILRAVYNLGDYLDRLFIFDFIIANRDRHGANIEVMQLVDGSFKLSPLFDNGVSFFAPIGIDEKSIRQYNVMSDMMTNNYIGSKSLFENLNLVRAPILLSKRFSSLSRAELYNFIFLDLDLPDYCKEVIFKQIVERVDYLISKGILLRR